MLAQRSNAFRQVVLVEYPAAGTWAIGFVAGTTKGEVQTITDEEVFNVFVPATPNPSTGFLLFVPKGDVRLLDMSTEEAAKLIISGGIVAPPERARAVSGGGQARAGGGGGERHLHRDGLQRSGAGTRAPRAGEDRRGRPPRLRAARPAAQLLLRRRSGDRADLDHRLDHLEHRRLRRFARHTAGAAGVEPGELSAVLRARDRRARGVHRAHAGGHVRHRPDRAPADRRL
ncbi:MAG: DUF502 domain-containing protein [Rhodovibrio sp.]|nr:DUF502 domain-containing protein [Rhodovibrio sp.]